MNFDDFLKGLIKHMNAEAVTDCHGPTRWFQHPSKPFQNPYYDIWPAYKKLTDLGGIITKWYIIRTIDHIEVSIRPFLYIIDISFYSSN